MAHELLLSSVCTDRLLETLQDHTKHLLVAQSSASHIFSTNLILRRRLETSAREKLMAGVFLENP